MMLWNFFTYSCEWINDWLTKWVMEIYSQKKTQGDTKKVENKYQVKSTNTLENGKNVLCNRLEYRNLF
jgi:hypothetical protein